ncbi:ANK-REP-REGION domain-containing protein [Mycena venus]|uniref:ANK-REP-REGION domain-containing protein n=1 Tax=Mycena venus TaxID=2733690 RepID=A0A8H6X2P3_9AGAR|nr:ANK-REP-REGION domain-containing protein [Mycena venus]
MAEVLGIITSVLQLVDSALRTRDYIEDFRHAPQEQQKLLSEMDNLRPLLIDLQARIGGNPSNATLQKMNSPLADFKATMEEFIKKLKPVDGRFLRFWKQLQWSLGDKMDAKEYLEKFQQFGSQVHMWLSVDLWDMAQQNRIELGAAERKQIIKWLSPINFFLRQADISQARQHGTGGWLLVDPHFQEWESGSGRTLWCHGIPGAGKTVLASMVVDHLVPKSQNKNLGVACIYLNHKEAEDHTPTRLLSSLWRQLVLGKDVGPLPKKLYERHQEKETSPSLDEVFEVLCSVITEFSKVYLVVDAVDEYPETQRQTLLKHLAELGPTVNLMITSRPHIAPDSSLPNSETIEIYANEDDVRKYVDAQIDIFPRLSKHVQSRVGLREEIHSVITCTVNGMFLLAKLHIESLSTKSTVKGVREALKTLPKTLNNSYDNAMKHIAEQDEESKAIAHLTLTWVANVKRPLTVLELRTALAVEPGAKSLDEDNILDMEIILSVCAGLVIIDKQLSVVRLVHYTTQEYLDLIQPLQFPDAQTEITRTLLTYMAFDEIVGLKDMDDNLPPLFEYSQHCLAHAVGPPEGALRDLLLEFLARTADWSEKKKVEVEVSFLDF